AAVVGNDVVLAAADGAIRSRVDIGAPVQWISPLPGGRVAVLRGGPPNELWVLDAGGTVVARGPAALSAQPPQADPAGALLMLSREGELVVLEPDGAERWRLSLRELVRPPVVPLPGGGIALATVGRNLLFLR